MEFFFYFLSFFAIFFTILIFFNKNPIYSLLYLILLLFCISGIFFTFNNFFIGAIEIIIYAGAIIVLFIFVVMLIDQNKIKENFFLEKNKLSFYLSVSFFLFLIFNYLSFFCKNKFIFIYNISVKNLGISLFGRYIFLVEISSLILLVSVLLSCFFTKDFNIYNKINKKDIV